MKQDLEVLAEVWPMCRQFDLQPGNVVIVAGCFTGKVMDLLLNLYPGIRIYGFDPQIWAIDKAAERLQEFSGQWSLFSHGLGTEDATIKMYDYETDACSTDEFDTHKPSFIGVFRDFNEVMRNLNIGYINLFVMNMEGYEFTLLPYLFEKDWLVYIEKLAIQWHLHNRPSSEMDVLINTIQASWHNLVIDNRPQWTYSVRED